MFSYEESDYLEEQTIAQIVKNALQIYRQHFWKFFVSYFLLMLPATFLAILAIVAMGALGVLDDSLFLAPFIYLTVGFVVSTVASLVVITVVADICLGQLPNLKRAWKHLSFRLVGKLIITNLISDLIFLIFIASGFVFFMWLTQSELPSWTYVLYAVFLILLHLALLSWFLLVPTIVALENRWGFRAMKRSLTLGYGYHTRNFVIVSMMFVLITVVPVILYFVSLVFGSEKWGSLLGICVYYVIGFLIQPLGLIYILLVYYDIRVRKEGWDRTALAEDLRH